MKTKEKEKKSGYGIHKILHIGIVPAIFNYISSCKFIDGPFLNSSKITY